MQGHADLSTFDYVGKDPLTAPILAAMRDAEGKPRVCDKVWISSLGCGGNQYSDPIDYLRMLAAFSLVMSFTGTTMFLVTGISGSQMPPVASCTVASLVARWRQ